jgi:hypothetical protein
MDRVALHLSPVIPLFAAFAAASERSERPWLARPLYIATAATVVLVLDLLALDGRMFRYLDISLERFQSPDDEVRLDTLCALALNGVLFYVLGSIIERRGTPLMQVAAAMLFVVAPFSALEPLAYLVESQHYKPVIDWVYVGLSATTVVLSHHRQRRSFYYAGLLNTALGLFLIADRREWFDDPLWGTTLIVLGLAMLGAGFIYDRLERRERGRPTVLGTRT